MKKVLFEIVVPAVVLALWMITCYPVCCKAEGFDYFLYWILVGCPYGIRKMCLYLIPKNFGIAGSMGVFALNCIIGGLIGGIVVIMRIAKIFTEIIKVIGGHFWTQLHIAKLNGRLCGAKRPHSVSEQPNFYQSLQSNPYNDSSHPSGGE